MSDAKTRFLAKIESAIGHFNMANEHNRKGNRELLTVANAVGKLGAGSGIGKVL